MQKYSKESPIAKLIGKITSVVNGQLFRYGEIEIENNNNVFSPEFTNCSIFFAENIKAKNGSTCIEIGVGSSFNLISLSKKYSDLNLFGCDINHTAIALSKSNLNRNGISKYSIFHSDLFDKAPSIQFDYIYFNPPLLFEKPNNVLQSSIFDENGKTITKFIKECKNYTHSDSIVYILYTKKNQAYIENQLELNGLFYSIVADKVLTYETYYVYEVTFKKTDSPRKNGIQHGIANSGADGSN